MGIFRKKKTKKHRRNPSRVFIDQFKNKWDSHDIAKYYYDPNNTTTGMDFAVVFANAEVEELFTALYNASVKADSVALSILKANKKRESISAEEKSYLYVVATRFTQALNDALIYEIIHDTYIVSDNPVIYYAIAEANQNVRKAAKCRAFKEVSGKNYNHVFWERPADIIKEDVPQITKLERFIIEKNLFNVRKMWRFFEKTQIFRTMIYYYKYKDVVPCAIMKSQPIPELKIYKQERKEYPG